MALSLTDLIEQLKTIQSQRGDIADLQHKDHATGEMLPLAAVVVDDDGTVHLSQYARGRVVRDNT